MRLTLHTDYALRTLIYLASVPDRFASAREIARAHGISENHLVKIVHKLGQCGFVETTRGRNGGIRLARSPAEIRIGEVVRQTEPTTVLGPCQAEEAKPPAQACCLLPDCGLRGVFTEANDAFFGVLDRYTLADVMKKSIMRTLFPPGVTV